jgi:hypothetical protein
MMEKAMFSSAPLKSTLDVFSAESDARVLQQGADHAAADVAKASRRSSGG